MRPSTRYGLVGICALALLSFVHWLRARQLHPEPVGEYLLGVTPNFAAAIAINFVLLSFWADQRRDAGFRSARYWFFVCAAISGVGLIGWELVQRTSQRLVFDLHDVLATLAGIGTATVLFHRIAPRASGSGCPPHRLE